MAVLNSISDSTDQRCLSDKEASSGEDILALDETCEDDRCKAPNAAIWHCVDCDSNYCSECWDYQGPHKSGKFGRDGVPHEKTNVRVVNRLKKILQPSQSPDTILKSHEADQCTKWFGVSRDLTGRPSLDDYGRYATLMGSLQPMNSSKCRYPQLVSFIGVTNAGKSTVIKMLVNHMQHNRVASRDFPTPVVGSVTNDQVSVILFQEPLLSSLMCLAQVPTSGDVHLYADQSTHATQLPILYADCEGFEGGEKTPLGARPKKRPHSESCPVQPEFAQARSWPVEWADTEESRQREFAVRELYPRLLYTFSDVVVFVLRNPKSVNLLLKAHFVLTFGRTFQSAVLTKLLEWGAAALEKSLNQPSLPHAIVLLNDTEPGVVEKEWETSYATQSLLRSVSGALDYVEGVPRFRELAQHWRKLGKQIVSVEDLILRYYSSFKVVRMPRKPRYTLMDRQIGKLHSEIQADCDASFRAKRKARMLTNSDELNVYLQSAFEHFTRTLATPFNFVAVSLLNNPISYDFGGHMLQLLNTVAMQEPSLRRDSGRSQWIFEKSCTMIASCVMLDCARFRKGRVEDLFDSYKKFFDSTLREYCDMWLPCGYSSGDGRHCVLVKARHATKGHQDEEGIMASGEYHSSFTAESYG
ncbi:hypothetical protein LTR37_005171 [Vermiconidia calcicola]|uniref:Uncharacterized protein n=1 Tax=Vermiconidia calcicola TaxID=1690605 RepID=A0ACC3NKA2_9PEZI|nr:hypothetical protein LTR37_005171 [Vermiconidia calcicola]